MPVSGTVRAGWGPSCQPWLQTPRAQSQEWLGLGVLSVKMRPAQQSLSSCLASSWAPASVLGGRLLPSARSTCSSWELPWEPSPGCPGSPSSVFLDDQSGYHQEGLGLPPPWTTQTENWEGLPQASWVGGPQGPCLTLGQVCSLCLFWGGVGGFAASLHPTSALLGGLPYAGRRGGAGTPCSTSQTQSFLVGTSLELEIPAITQGVSLVPTPFFWRECVGGVQ